MIVVDTAVIIDALVAVPRRAHVLARLSAEAELHAPHLIDLEFLQVLRSLVLAGELTVDRAGDARVDYEELRIVRYPHQPLSDRIWELRDNVTAYDAAFVALAEILEAPLVTTDRRLARASGHRAHIELVEPGTG